MSLHHIYAHTLEKGLSIGKWGGNSNSHCGILLNDGKSHLSFLGCRGKSLGAPWPSFSILPFS